MNPENQFDANKGRTPKIARLVFGQVTGSCSDTLQPTLVQPINHPSMLYISIS
jgi:hypothetical protein